MKTRIKELRARHDLTQEELAKKVGVRRETILFLEKGKYNPSLKLAYNIAKVLKSKIEDVFIFEETLSSDGELEGAEP
jgi:putative transcriptional regulator